MKRQKRDPQQRAYHRGYLFGIQGKSKSLCPENQSLHQDWMNGWRDGRTNQWESTESALRP